MKVLVTGANGMLATHTIRELVSQGFQVRGLLRDQEKFQLKNNPSVELMEGDIRDREAVETAVQGCYYLIHIAALTSPALLHYKQYHEVNVTGTLNLLRAASQAGVRRTIYVGSANAIGHGNRAEPGKEDHAVKEPFSSSHYAKSKLEGQLLALSFRERMEVVVLNPTFMIGGYDGNLGSGRIIQMALKKRIIFYPAGGKNFVNTEDVAKGIFQALTTGKSGEIYLMGGENLSYEEFFRKLKAKVPGRKLLVRIPAPLLLVLGYFSEIPRMLGISTDLSLVNMRILNARNYYDNSKARKELGITFHPIDKGMEQAIQWFSRQQNL